MTPTDITCFKVFAKIFRTQLSSDSGCKWSIQAPRPALLLPHWLSPSPLRSPVPARHPTVMENRFCMLHFSLDFLFLSKTCTRLCASLHFKNLCNTMRTPTRKRWNTGSEDKFELDLIFTSLNWHQRWFNSKFFNTLHNIEKHSFVYQSLPISLWLINNIT